MARAWSRPAAARSAAAAAVLLGALAQASWQPWAPVLFFGIWTLAPLTHTNLLLLLPWASLAAGGLRTFCRLQLLQLAAGAYFFLLAELLEVLPHGRLRPLLGLASRLQLPWRWRERLACCTPLTALYVLVVELSLIPPVLTLAVLSRLACPAPGAVGRCAARGPTVVLVHGNGINEGQWVIGRILLALEGIKVVRVNYLTAGCLCTEAPATDGLPEVSDTFRAALDGCSQDAELLLVGHSLGALVSVAAAADEAEKRVRRVVAVSGPFRGSDLLGWGVSRGLHRLLWPFGLPPLLRDLAPESEAQQQVLALESRFEGKVHVESIAGALDPIVRPGSASFGPQTRLPHCAHYCIASSRRLWEEVVRHFREEFPEERARCVGPPALLTGETA